MGLLLIVENSKLKKLGKILTLNLLEEILRQELKN